MRGIAATFVVTGDAATGPIADGARWKSVV